jgi:hypothetical protein
MDKTRPIRPIINAPLTASTDTPTSSFASSSKQTGDPAVIYRSNEVSAHVKLSLATPNPNQSRKFSLPITPEAATLSAAAPKTLSLKGKKIKKSPTFPKQRANLTKIAKSLTVKAGTLFSDDKRGKRIEAVFQKIEELRGPKPETGYQTALNMSELGRKIGQSDNSTLHRWLKTRQTHKDWIPQRTSLSDAQIIEAEAYLGLSPEGNNL